MEDDRIKLDFDIDGPNFIRVDRSGELSRGGKPDGEDEQYYLFKRHYPFINGASDHRVILTCSALGEKFKVVGENNQVKVKECSAQHNEDCLWHFKHVPGDNKPAKRMYLKIREQEQYFYYNPQKDSFFLGGIDDQEVLSNSVFYIYQW